MRVNEWLQKYQRDTKTLSNDEKEIFIDAYKLGLYDGEIKGKIELIKQEMNNKVE